MYPQGTGQKIIQQKKEMKVVIIKGMFRHEGKSYLVGDELTVSSKVGNAICKSGKASKVDYKTKEEKVPQESKGIDEIPALRKEYKNLTGENANKRWKEERLREEINKNG